MAKPGVAAKAIPRFGAQDAARDRAVEVFEAPPHPVESREKYPFVLSSRAQHGVSKH